MRTTLLAGLLACGVPAATTPTTLSGQPPTPPPAVVIPPTTPTTADTHNGTRLQQSYWVGADGSRVSRGFIDTNYTGNNQCIPLVLVDGNTYCVPYDQIANSTSLGPSAFVQITAAQ